MFMPEGAKKNANHGAMPDSVAERVGEGELLVDDEHLPLLWSRSTPWNYDVAHRPEPRLPGAARL